MALIVETGSAAADSESYTTVLHADTYFANRGITNWSVLSTTEKEQALRRATDFMSSYAWAGSRVNGTQALDWPRSGLYVNGFDVALNSVPLTVQNACLELAIRAAAGELAPDIGRQEVRVKVGPIETEYSDKAVPYTKFRAIDNLLSAYLSFVKGGVTVGLVRS